jgi:hypothetical protein
MVRRGVVMRKFGSVIFADWRAARAKCVFESVICLPELVAGAACVDECVCLMIVRRLVASLDDMVEKSGAITD